MSVVTDPDLTGVPEGGPTAWDSGTAYSTGALALDRGGIWQATGSSTNSQPVSGNADWTLVGGTPYVEMIFDPVDQTTAPFYDATSSGPGVSIIPAPGAGYAILPAGDPLVISLTSSGAKWGGGGDVNFAYGAPGGFTFNGALVAGVGSSANQNEPYAAFGSMIDNATAVGSMYADPDDASTIENKPIVVWIATDRTNGGFTYGSRSQLVRVYYHIAPLSSASFSSFYRITALNQGAKTFTVTDAGADLNGATGTFDVVGSTANDGTYTIVSAVSGAGDTVITVSEAIPSATADGWAKFV